MGKEIGPPIPTMALVIVGKFEWPVDSFETTAMDVTREVIMIKNDGTRLKA